MIGSIVPALTNELSGAELYINQTPGEELSGLLCVKRISVEVT